MCINIYTHIIYKYNMHLLSSPPNIEDDIPPPPPGVAKTPGVRPPVKEAPHPPVKEEG